MPSVRVKENEPFDVALRRFKRSCEKAGILAEVSKNLGEPMVGRNVSQMPEDEKIAGRGW